MCVCVFGGGGGLATSVKPMTLDDHTNERHLKALDKASSKSEKQ